MTRITALSTGTWSRITELPAGSRLQIGHHLDTVLVDVIVFFTTALDDIFSVSKQCGVVTGLRWAEQTLLVRLDSGLLRDWLE